MANHIGIELVPSLCRVVVLERRSGLFRRRSNRSARVTALHEVPYHPASPGQLTEELRRLGLRGPAHVAIWGLRGDHRVMSLPPADPVDLEAMARREAGRSGPVTEVSDGIMLGDVLDSGQRQVTYVSMPAADVRAGIRPLADAGVDVISVMSPAQAHAVLARQRLGVLSGAATAILSIQARVTGLTVVRGGAVLFARELPWGHETERAVPEGVPSGGGEFSARVSSELRRSLVYLKQQHQAEVSQVLLCGDVPDLRALTGPLMHDLNLDVETLDSPDGFDLTDLPSRADEFGSRLGAFRTAWALAASEAPTVNLLPRGSTTVPRPLRTGNQNRVWRAAVVGLAIAALAWAAVELLGRTTRTRTDGLRREIAALQPEVERIDANRLARTTDAARAAALKAFASEGPRLARVLETLGRSAPPEVAITSLVVSPGAGTWNVSIVGQTLAPTPAEAQAAFNRFAKTLTGHEHLGIASQTPEIKVHVEEPTPVDPALLGSDPAERDRQDVNFEPRTVGRWERLQPGARPSVSRGRDGDRVKVENGILYQWVEHRVDSDRRRAVTSTDGRAGIPEPTKAKYVGAVLDFTLHYEVRK